ncbi:hypothetical protein [Dapis sp. BLCC M229]|uniref:hypothetical protein n=1 Tax=Dapis sp. BLCC M229 TaxID=3400188 RepID=UPI003CEE53BE
MSIFNLLKLISKYLPLELSRHHHYLFHQHQKTFAGKDYNGENDCFEDDLGYGKFRGQISFLVA